MNTNRLKSVAGATAISIAVATGLFASPAQAKMQSSKISKNVCQTTGGKRIVGIPGFPGERIDQRLLKDIKFLQRKYKIFITDGYSNDPVHSANGEHPMGLALDIVPNFARGGDWNDIDRLARFAEPRQNQVSPPFRWVGYNGDAGHGRGHHLHLSYSHSVTRPGQMADMVYTLRCPEQKKGAPSEPEPKVKDHSMSGGAAGSEPGGGGGGIGTRSAVFGNAFELAPVAPETGGVDG